MRKHTFANSVWESLDVLPCRSTNRPLNKLFFIKSLFLLTSVLGIVLVFNSLLISKSHANIYPVGTSFDDATVLGPTDSSRTSATFASENDDEDEDDDDDDDDDYVYYLFLKANTTYTFTLSGPSGTNFNLSLYDSTQALLDWTDSSTYPETLTYTTGDQWEICYLQVSADVGSGSYSLEWDLSPYDLHSAYNATLWNETNHVESAFDSQHNDHYYRLSFASNQRIQFKLEGLEGTDFDLYLLDSSGTIIDSSTLYDYPDIVTITTPSAPQYVQVRRDSGSGQYALTLTPVGSIEVNLCPAAAINDGAQWALDGGEWHESGETVNDIPEGTHTISYRSISGWEEPDSEHISITPDETLIHNANCYEELTTWYRDADGDGYGNPDNSTTEASQPSGYVSNNDDCDDTDDQIHPEASERCNGIDDDCDGQVDEDLTQNTYYRDSDEDGYGDPNITTLDCSAPSGYVSNNDDCDDTDSQVNPGASEVCNGEDDDCDGQIDEGARNTYYRDSDQDGYGDPNNSTLDCSAPSGYVSNNDDCDDTDSQVHPGASEVCNGEDDDCDGQIDEGDVCPPPQTYYKDGDNDGYGNPDISQESDSQPPGYVENDRDCDDTTASIHPGATEKCDGVDQDCDGTIDEGCNNYYRDADSDGYGNPDDSTTATSPPSGYVNNNDDCNDTDSQVHPGASEVCNEEDDDCDGQVDEGLNCDDQNGNGMPDSMEVTDPSSDMDNDGSSDFNDPDSVRFECVNDDNDIVGFYTSRGNLLEVQNVEHTDSSINQSGKPTDATFPYGVFNCRIEGLNNGEQVTMTFVFPEDVPSNARFYKITNSGWSEVNYQPGSSDNEIVVTLTDGDPDTDMDGTANGEILDPSSIVYVSGASSDDGDSDGSTGGSVDTCFIDSLFKF